MSSESKVFDCVIAGGGPGGSALAGLLARRGRSVALVHDGRARHATAVETILPAALPALERCGLAEVVRRASEADDRRHGARWDHDEWSWQPAARPGLCIERNSFDAALQSWAQAQAAHVVQGTVADVRFDPSAHTIEVQQHGTKTILRARTLALATGRRSLRALVATSTVATGPETAAFALQGAAPESARSLATVEAAPEGWSWWIGNRHGNRSDGGSGVVVVDVGEVQRCGRAAMVDAVLAAALGPAACLRSARLVGAVRATARVQATDQPVFLLGDAAASLDPLASQGTEKALVSADAAAAAIDLALRQPSHGELARLHHARWELDLWHAHQRAAHQFYARVARFAEQPFWAARLGAGTAPTTSLPERLVTAPGVQPAVALRRVGEQLEPEPGLAVGGSLPIARLGRIVIAPICRAFAQPQTVDRGIALAGQDPALFACGSAAVRLAILELHNRGFLQPA